MLLELVGWPAEAREGSRSLRKRLSGSSAILLLFAVAVGVCIGASCMLFVPCSWSMGTGEVFEGSLGSGTLLSPRDATEGT